MKTLEQLYHDFYSPTQQTNLQNTIKKNHKILIENLSKEHRKIVLRMMDAQMMIGSLQSEESFICGFKLALQILTELEYDTGRSIEVGLDVSDQFFMEEKNNEDDWGDNYQLRVVTKKVATNPVAKRLCEHIVILENRKIGNKMVWFLLKSRVAPFLIVKPSKKYNKLKPRISIWTAPQKLDIWYNSHIERESGVVFMPKVISNKQYAAEFKLPMIETMQKEKLSYSETGRKFDVYCKRIMDLERIYLTYGAEGFAIERRGRGGLGKPIKITVKA